jgi:hypothetical protein
LIILEYTSKYYYYYYFASIDVVATPPVAYSLACVLYFSKLMKILDYSHKRYPFIGLPTKNTLRVSPYLHVIESRKKPKNVSVGCRWFPVELARVSQIEYFGRDDGLRPSIEEAIMYFYR